MLAQYRVASARDHDPLANPSGHATGAARRAINALATTTIHNNSSSSSSQSTTTRQRRGGGGRIDNDLAQRRAIVGVERDGLIAVRTPRVRLPPPQRQSLLIWFCLSHKTYFLRSRNTSFSPQYHLRISLLIVYSITYN
jgi:hypothetical protein